MGLLYNEFASSSGPAYKISKSVRINRQFGTANYFTRTPTTAGNRKIWTLSLWVKRGAYSANVRRTVFGSGATGTDSFNTFSGGGNSNNIYFGTGITGASGIFWRDSASWAHLVYIVDTTLEVQADRFKAYVNGVRTSGGVFTIPLNFDTFVNATVPMYVGTGYGFGADDVNTTGMWDGNIAEVVFLDGIKASTTTKIINGVSNEVLTQLGEFSPVTGVWEARKWTGAYGTNGFYLNFSDGTSTTTLGYDYSGNNNHFTPVGLVRSSGDPADCWTNDVPPNNGDTNPLIQPSSNYCVLNAIDMPLGYIVYNANATGVADLNHYGNRGTMPYPNTGKWYWEATVGTTTTTTKLAAVGVATATATLNSPLQTTANAYGVAAVNTIYGYSNATNPWSATGTFAVGDTIQVAFDPVNLRLWIGKNNVWYNSTGGTTGDPAAGTNATFTIPAGEYFPYIQLYDNTIITNFGQVSFNYTPPTGFTTLCAANISKSGVVNGGKFMDATLYTGNSSSQTIASQFASYPDLVWVKTRNTTEPHILTDSNTGASKYWSTNSLNAQVTGAATFINAISSSGFTVGSAAAVNGSDNSLVAWQWQAGQGVTSTNTAGQVTSTVCVNQVAGFSTISYTGTGTTFGGAPNYVTSIGHGLNVAPKFWVIKRLDIANPNFNYAYTTGIDGSLDVFYINATDAKIDSTTASVTSSTISLPFSNPNFGASGGSYLIYAWAEVPGFSKMGSYVGANDGGFALGPFVYTGFRPKFIMIKAASTTGDWTIFDSSRYPFNLGGAGLNALYPNLTNADTPLSASLDIVSNGFKLRVATTEANTTGVTYFYMAFAENPFAQANAR
jgi:hypothetical protein